MYFKILLFTLAFTVNFQTPDAAVEKQAQPSIADCRTSMEISQKATLSQALALALSDIGMAGGVVNTEGCEQPAKEFYIPLV